MTIDEAIEQFKEDAEYNRDYLDLEWAEENEQVAEWLEELKMFRQQAKNSREWIDIGYKKGVDDFKTQLLELCSGEDCWNCSNGHCDKCMENTVDYSSIVDLAEQLKAGNNG